MKGIEKSVFGSFFEVCEYDSRLFIKIRNWLYKQHCKKCSCYEGIDCLNSCIGKCKYSVWQIDLFLREE